MPAGTRTERFRLDLSATGAERVRREVADVNRENSRLRETAGAAATGVNALAAAGNQVAAVMNAAVSQQNKMGVAIAGTNEKMRAQASAMQLAFSAAKIHGKEMIELGSATERTARQVERASLAWKNYRNSATGAIAAGRAVPWAPGQGAPGGGAAAAAARGGLGRGVFGAASTVTATLGVGYLGMRGIQLLGEYEEAALSLEKVLKGTADEQQRVVDSINQLALALPKTRKELLSMAAAGAQMGIANRLLDEFTESFTRLDSAADTIGVADALQFGQVQSFLKETKVGFEELAGIIVELGNTMPATERDILEMLHQVSGGLGTIRREAGLSGADVGGISGALASAGAEPGSARRTMREFFTALVLAQNGATEEMKAFVNVTGVAEERLKQMSSAEVLGKFIQGVNRLGVGSQKFMDVLQLDGKRAAAVLAALSLRADEFGAAIASASEQAANGGQAAVAESEKKFGSMLARLTVVWNAINQWVTSEEASTGRNFVATAGELIASRFFADDATKLQFRQRWRDQHEPGSFLYENQQDQIDILTARIEANRPAGWRWDGLGQGRGAPRDFAARAPVDPQGARTAAVQKFFRENADFSLNPADPTNRARTNANQARIVSGANFAASRRAVFLDSLLSPGERGELAGLRNVSRANFAADRRAAFRDSLLSPGERGVLAGLRNVSGANFAADRRAAFRDSFARPFVSHDDLTFTSEQGNPLDAFREGVTGLSEELTDGEKALLKFKGAGQQFRRATDQLVAGLFDSSRSISDILNNILRQAAVSYLQDSAGDLLDYVAPTIVSGLNGLGGGAGAGSAQADRARGAGRGGAGAGSAQADRARGAGRGGAGRGGVGGAAPAVVVNLGVETSRAEQIKTTQAVSLGVQRAMAEQEAVNAQLGR